jgi:hypothetical protein
MTIEQEYLLYLELKACLEDSRSAFIHFQSIALPKWHARKELQLAAALRGACSLPGWQEYIETVALPLNRRTFAVIQQIDDPQPYALSAFVAYHQLFENAYAEWARGENPSYPFLAGFRTEDGTFVGVNFPDFIETFVNQQLFTLVHFKEPISIQPTQEPSMASKAFGGIAFLLGLGVGAVATVFAQPLFPEREAVTELDTDLEDGDEFDNTTEEEINDAGEPSGALIDSLQGITVSGRDAKMVTVRVLGIERAKAVAMWGTKGIDGDEPTTFRRIADLSTEHLVNIRDKSSRASESDIAIINSVLEDRVAAGEADESLLDD